MTFKNMFLIFIFTLQLLAPTLAYGEQQPTPKSLCDQLLGRLGVSGDSLAALGREARSAMTTPGAPQSYSKFTVVPLIEVINRYALFYFEQYFGYRTAEHPFSGFSVSYDRKTVVLKPLEPKLGVKQDLIVVRLKDEKAIDSSELLFSFSDMNESAFSPVFLGKGQVLRVNYMNRTSKTEDIRFFIFKNGKHELPSLSKALALELKHVVPLTESLYYLIAQDGREMIVDYNAQSSTSVPAEILYSKSGIENQGSSFLEKVLMYSRGQNISYARRQGRADMELVVQAPPSQDTYKAWSYIKITLNNDEMAIDPTSKFIPVLNDKTKSVDMQMDQDTKSTVIREFAADGRVISKWQVEGTWKNTQLYKTDQGFLLLHDPDVEGRLQVATYTYLNANKLVLSIRQPQSDVRLMEVRGNVIFSLSGLRKNNSNAVDLEILPFTPDY